MKCFSERKLLTSAVGGEWKEIQKGNSYAKQCEQMDFHCSIKVKLVTVQHTEPLSQENATVIMYRHLEQFVSDRMTSEIPWYYRVIF